jgi:hypothetical protein
LATRSRRDKQVKELVAVERELLGVLAQLSRPGIGSTEIQRLRDQLEVTAHGLARIGRDLPERDMLKSLYNYIESRSGHALDMAREREGLERELARERASRPAPSVTRSVRDITDHTRSLGIRPVHLRANDRNGRGRGFGR